MKIDPRKLEVINHMDGPLLVIAGPGAGKTMAMVERIVSMLEKGVKPENMMVSTFTEKAAKELMTRISDRLDEKKLGDKISLNEMYLGTMHAIFLRLLKDFAEYTDLAKNYKMLDEFDQKMLVMRNWSSFTKIENLDQVSPELSRGENPHPRGTWTRVDEVCRYVNKVREELEDLKALKRSDDAAVRAVAEACELYETLLDADKALDFSDIQVKMLRLLKGHRGVLKEVRQRIKYLIIDEYQDTNSIQQEILLLLAGKDGNICVVGDEDQSIYRFRGASVKNILTFESNFSKGACKKVILETNFRSHPDIVKFYNSWMDQLVWTQGKKNFRYPKTIVANPEKTWPDCPGVVAVTGGTVEDWCEQVYRFIGRLQSEKVVTDVNQIAFLFSTVRAENGYTNSPTEVKQLTDYLTSHGIGVYTPRSGVYFQQDVVKLCVGLMVKLLPDALALNAKLGTVDVRNQRHYQYFQACEAFLDAELAKKANAPLKDWIAARHEELDNLVKGYDDSFLSLFYKALAFPLFKRYLVVDKVDGTPVNSREAYNLGMFTQLLSKFEYTFNITVINANFLERNIKHLFSDYLRHLYNGGLHEFEDYDETIPSGCVSVMTIHQSKGLEFPVTVVGSLTKTPRSTLTPLDRALAPYFSPDGAYEPLDLIRDFDFWRLYYVAFSRPQNLLVLSGFPSGRAQSFPSRVFAPIVQDVPGWEDKVFKPKNLALKKVKAAKLKKDYAFTSDIALYERCPTQYMAFSHLGFAEKRVAGTMFGSLVHQTIEDIHKAYKRGEEIDDSRIEDWFNANYDSLVLSLKTYLDPKRKQVGLEQVLNYYVRNKADFGRIVEAEFDVSVVQKGYVLHGVIDLLCGDNDTVEIVDFKTDAIPSLEDADDAARVAQYRRQLETYAQIVEKKYGKPVSKLHLYYTRAGRKEEPCVTFDYDKAHAAKTLSEIDAVVANIEAYKFSNESVKKCATLCGECDLRHYCGWKGGRDAEESDYRMAAEKGRRYGKRRGR